MTVMAMLASCQGQNKYSLTGQFKDCADQTIYLLCSGNVLDSVYSADGSFSFDDLVEGDYLMDYYFPEEGRDLPDAGSVEPLRYGSAWRAISDTLKVKNGENLLDSLTKVVPSL